MSLKTITVTRWFNDNTKKKYTVDIYEDDNIENAKFEYKGKLDEILWK